MKLPLVLLLLVAACSTGGETSPTEPSTVTTSPTTTADSTTTLPPETTTTSSTTTPTPPEGVLPTLDDGRPATWVGVTDDYEAVEVDTASGEIVRSLGQVSTAEDVATAECSACINAIDAVWRTFDGSHFMVSECCEPAAGLLHVLSADELPLLPGDDTDPWFFWRAAPSPDSNDVVLLGYQVILVSAAVEATGAVPDVDYTEVWTSEGEDAFPISNAVWDGDTIRWLEQGGGEVRLRTFQLGADESETLGLPELAGWSTAGLTRRSSGDLVAVGSTGEDAATEAFIIDTEGAVIDTLTVAAGAQLGGYDRTGEFLIYTDADGVVHWQSGDDSGVLAEGFVHASW